MTKNNREYSNINIKSAFYSEIAIGVPPNIFLLIFHIRLWLLRQKPKPTDIPIGLVALFHLVILLTSAFIGADIFMPQARSWDDITCKSLIYFYRVMRGLSICAISLLSVLQAVTLSPRSSCLAKFKHRSLYHYLCSLLFLWVLYASITSHLLISTVATPNLTSYDFMYITESCSLLYKGHSLQHAFSMLLTFRESFFMGLMALSGGYMVILLCRHKKQSQQLYLTKLSSREPPEQRATRTVLLLLGFFLFMSILDSFCNYARNVLKDCSVIYFIQLFVSHSYATVSPLVFISTEKRIVIFPRSVCGGR
ncbi:vomeronasal type-1 receptor 48-like [Ctenodactylus gundi]